MTTGIPSVFFWRFLRALGLKRQSWDLQFRAGVWDRGPRSSRTIEHVIELCGGGFLVEFGCGEGTLPLALPRSAYSRYVGYDISDVAVRKAEAKARVADRSNCEFEQCDMAKWEGTSGVSLVVAEECLYYLRPTDAEAFLRRCCDSLVAEGSVLVIVHSVHKHASTLDSCRRICRVKNEFMAGNRAYLVLGSNAAPRPSLEVI